MVSQNGATAKLVESGDHFDPRAPLVCPRPRNRFRLSLHDGSVSDPDAESAPPIVAISFFTSVLKSCQEKKLNAISSWSKPPTGTSTGQRREVGPTATELSSK